MKKGEVYTGVIGDTSFPDRGYVELPDGKVLIKHAVPGREVEFRLSKRRGDRGEGTVLRTVKPSPLETFSEPCPHCDFCGGCLYQTVPYGAQLSLKERQLRELLEAQYAAPFAWEGILGSPLPDRYRAKMEYSFGDSFKNGPLELGLHRRGSFYDILTTDRCRLVHEDFNRILRATLDYFREKKTPYYHKQRRDGWLRHLLVRRGANSGEILADLVTCPDSFLEGAAGTGKGTSAGELLREWKERIFALPLEGTLAGILRTVNASPADAVIDQGTEVLYGEAGFEETLSGLKFRITPFSFFQNNSGGAELLYGKVGEYAGDTAGKTVFDLYCGTGTIAQLTARTAERTVGVEIVPEAVRAAEENARRNGITNCSFIAGDVLKVLDELPKAPDTVILDPPREGVHPKAMKRIAAGIGPQRIVYVSCKPGSFGKDLEIMREAGYRLRRACGVDMFPQTPNAELVCLLTKEGEESPEVKTI